MGGKKKIPEGWLQYSPLGNPIPGTVIICFKVPLKAELCRSIPNSDWFTPSMLMAKVPNLAGIIDVTNTIHYYDNRVILNNGILHEKIQCPGHVVPPAHVVESFQKVMQRMWTTAESGGKLVGVHCTHGINRTGYLVCRYLIECRGFQPEDAIRLFAESRGHGIERQNYLSDLRTLKPGHRSPNAIPA
ncbi:RNA/RNP complex-1-interacting phosphatase isoform X2 [Hetaerina americana]|uniref:RNA/RNP complex-1-interacting phosphatase isoform X2 n=1 Tax=Hetaerina americana TaxID=62018 RepID=UPI003A7F546A